MKIYVGHSRKFDFKNELYNPIKESDVYKNHEIVLPHLNSDVPYNSKDYFELCDLMIAEVSYPSLGLGVELGWANAKNIPILALYKEESTPSNSVTAVTKNVVSYKDEADLVNQINHFIKRS